MLNSRTDHSQKNTLCSTQEGLRISQSKEMRPRELEEPLQATWSLRDIIAGASGGSSLRVTRGLKIFSSRSMPFSLVDKQVQKMATMAKRLAAEGWDWDTILREDTLLLV